MKKRVLLPAVLMATLLSSSCKLFHRSAKGNTPSPPKPTLKLPEPPKTEQASLPPPPVVQPGEPDLSQPPPSTAPPKVPPYRGKPRGGQVARNRTGANEPQPGAEQQTSNSGPVETTTASVPQLEEVLSPEQQQAYNEAIDRNIGRAQKTVTALKDRRLSPEQSTYLERLKTFVQQAIEARKTDLFRARSLAERASVLAEDLLRSMQ